MAALRAYDCIMLCRHCAYRNMAIAHATARNRELCTTCYLTPEIRALYPIPERRGRRFDRDTGNDADIAVPGGKIKPCKPTSALPGSAVKFRLLCWRARNNRALWHDDDAKAVDGDAPANDNAIPATEPNGNGPILVKGLRDEPIPTANQHAYKRVCRTHSATASAGRRMFV